MGASYDRSLTGRQRRRNNRLCGEEAIARGKTYFTAICGEHGETDFKINKLKERWFPLCLQCVKEREFAARLRRSKNPQELQRRRDNREILVKALKEGLAQVEMTCLHHGFTMFEISGITQKCILCRRSARLKQYYRNKGKADASLGSS